MGITVIGFEVDFGQKLTGNSAVDEKCSPGDNFSAACDLFGMTILYRYFKNETEH